MILCFSWTTSDTINILILIVYAFMAYFLRKTFIEGKKQTKTSLSINQFNIFQKELDGFIEEAKQIKFKSNNQQLLKIYETDFAESNGIYYIGLFKILDQIKFYAIDSEERRAVIDDFRHQILFPLFRFYDKLFHFLIRIKKDEILSNEYKNILYNYVERDILQSYFRLSNNAFGNHFMYDLSVFKNQAFDPTSLYRINKFYIDNTCFQYKNLEFYIDTL